MSAAPDALLVQLHLHQAAAALPAWLDRAAQEELGYADFLGGLLEDELAARTTAETQRRLRQAGFPFAATIEQFDFRFRPELKRQVVLRYLGSSHETDSKAREAVKVATARPVESLSRPRPPRA